MKGNFAAIVLVVVGIIVLLNNLGIFNFNVVDVLRVWWPAALIVLGAAMFFMPKEKLDSQDKR